MNSARYGAIEAGGTKFVCAVAAEDHQILAETRIATTTPPATLSAVLEFFDAAQARFGALASFGIASFGPVDLDPDSPRWGQILATPKPNWEGADLIAPLRARYGRPVAIDTDVNAAALAELTLGAGRGACSLAYVTVGTGIGGGAVISGATVRGQLHPEMGHIRVRRAPGDEAFAGICPFHGDCLEGLACGPAIKARWGTSLDQLPQTHPAHDIIGNYLGQLAATIALMLSTQRIVFGGGVMTDGQLLARIRAAAAAMLNGYLPAERFGGFSSAYITLPELGAQSGILGAVLMAKALRAAPARG